MAWHFICKKNKPLSLVTEQLKSKKHSQLEHAISYKFWEHMLNWRSSRTQPMLHGC